MLHGQKNKKQKLKNISGNSFSIKETSSPKASSSHLGQPPTRVHKEPPRHFPKNLDLGGHLSMDSLSCLKNLKHLHPIPDRPPKKKSSQKKKTYIKSLQIFAQHLSMNGTKAISVLSRPKVNIKKVVPKHSEHNLKQAAISDFKTMRDMPLKQEAMLVEVRHRSWWLFSWKKPGVFFWKEKTLPKWSIGKKTTSWHNSKHFRQAHGWTNHTNRCGASRPNSAHRLATARCSASLRALSVNMVRCDVCHPSKLQEAHPTVEAMEDIQCQSFYHPCICFIHSSLSSPNSFRNEASGKNTILWSQT